LALVSALGGCGGPTDSNRSLQVIETSSQPAQSETETVRVNNCDGKADATQIAQRAQAIQVEGGAQLGVGIGVIQTAVTAKYGTLSYSSKSQQLTAPPGTSMEFALVWTLEQRTGTVSEDGQSAKQALYHLFRPMDVQIQSQRDLGCVGPAASVGQPKATLEQTSTPIPTPTVPPIKAPTAIPDTPPGSVLEVGQRWTQGGLELLMESAKLSTGNIYDQIGTGIETSFRLYSRRMQDITLRYSVGNMTAQDNRGRRLKVDACLYGCGSSHWDVVTVLRSGATLGFGFIPGQENATSYVEVDTTDLSIIEVIITISDVSNISNARWRVPLAH